MGMAGAVVGAGAMGLVGSAMGASAAGEAADQAYAGSMAGVREQQRQFDITQQQNRPWLQAGRRGLSEYEQMIRDRGDYDALIKSDVPDPFSFTAEDFEEYKDPGYDFRVSEGERALSRAVGSKGQLNSGTRYRGLMDLGQQMASAEFGAARGRAYQDYASGVASEQETYQRSLADYGRQYTDPMSQWAQISGTGQATAANLGQMRQGMADQVSAGMGQAGAYSAAGTMGQARAWQSGLSDIANMYGSYTAANNAPSSYNTVGAYGNWFGPGPAQGGR
jgi:hypothetical protein